MNVQRDAYYDAPDLLTVKLEKLVYGGDALGRLPDGRAVFVPFALPGETASVHILEEKRGHVRTELVKVLEPSPERITPKCKHFGICGGCHYQHLSYSSQLQAKTEILRDQLRRIGKIENPPITPMLPSPHQWNYRNHVQFHLTREGKLGYIDTQARNVLPISECHLPEAPLNDLWPQLEFDPDLRLERVSLRLGMDDEAMLVLESGNPEPPELELETDLSVVHLVEGDTVVMAGNKDLLISVNSRLFHVSAASFFQVNTGMAEEMVKHLLANLPANPAAMLLDVYCGVGLFSAFFASRVERLIGIELSPSACEDFTTNLDEFENVELYEAPAEEILPRLNDNKDRSRLLETVIVDPPRAGLERRAVDALLVQNPECIAYVSCDPSTLSRDIARFTAGGYRLVQVTPFDLFPQTYSIESISILKKG